MRHRITVLRTAVAAALMALLGLGLAALPASAATGVPAQTHAAVPAASTLTRTTTVTTAPGIATTLLSAGIAPLPLPRTHVGLKFSNGSLQVTYGFPITGGNPSLTGPSGNIYHAGGIYFASLTKHLAIGNFDINLAKGTIFAKRVNFAPSNTPVLDLNLSKLKVSTVNGKTVLSNIGLYLDPAAAGALNSTFGINLPTDGSLWFGTGRVVLG